MLKTFTTVKDIIEIKRPAKGISLSNIPEDAMVRVDRVDTTGSKNIFPELKVKELVDMFVTLSASYPFVKLTTGKYEKVVIPFTTSGVMEFNDDFLYEVTIDGNTDTNSVTLETLDSLISGSPIRIQRIDIKGNLKEDNISTAGIEHLFFPNGLPEKVEARVFAGGSNRKVVLSKTQMQDTLGVNEVIGKSGSAYTYETAYKTLEVRPVNEVTVHTLGDGNDFTFYALDVI